MKEQTVPSINGKHYYLCDPEKHTECQKRHCGYLDPDTVGACYYTTHREYARDGVPVCSKATQGSIGLTTEIISAEITP